MDKLKDILASDAGCIFDVLPHGVESNALVMDGTILPWSVSATLIIISDLELRDYTVVSYSRTHDIVLIRALNLINEELIPVYITLNNDNCISKRNLRNVEYTHIYNMDDIDYWGRIEGVINAHDLECNATAFIERLLQGMVDVLTIDEIMVMEDWTDMAEHLSDGWWEIRNIVQYLFGRLQETIGESKLIKYRITIEGNNHKLILFVKLPVVDIPPVTPNTDTFWRPWHEATKTIDAVTGADLDGRLPLTVNIDMTQHHSLFYINQVDGTTFSNQVRLEECMQLPSESLTFYFSAISTLMTKEFFIGFFKPIIDVCNNETDFYNRVKLVANEYMTLHIKHHVTGAFHGQPKYAR